MEKSLVFDYFKKISQIPRGSGNEKGISDYLVKLGEEKGYKVVQDKTLNVVMDVPASKGKENNKRVILQGHMDMVCEKLQESDHDFLKDPIELIQDGDKLHANKTTLGADDGVGLASALALAEETSHGPMTIIVTVSEETDMHGAKELDPKHLEGDYLINIDSEDEGVLTVSSAGGKQYQGIFAPDYEDFEGTILKIDFGGFEGGHSGVEIAKNRGNMIKVMAGFVKLSKSRLVDFNCGTKDNAIPREGFLKIELKEDIFEEIKKEIEEKYKEVEGKLEIKAEKEDYKGKIQNKKSTEDFADLLLALPTGVKSFTDESKKFLESSSNLAIVRRSAEDEEKYEIKDSIRFAKSSLLEDFEKTFTKISKDYPVEVNFINYYPEWEYKKESDFRELVNKTYKDQYGKEMSLEITHGGLECGVFYKKNPNLDIVSIGPTITGAHTPKETLYIESTKRVFKHLKAIVENLK